MIILGFIIPPPFQMSGSSCNVHRKQCTFLPAASDRAGRKDREYPGALSQAWLLYLLSSRHETLPPYSMYVVSLSSCEESVLRDRNTPALSLLLLRSFSQPQQARVVESLKGGESWGSCGQVADKGAEEIIRASNAEEGPLIQPWQAF